MDKVRERSRSPLRFNIYISNLPNSFPQPRLFSMFSKFGVVTMVRIESTQAIIRFKAESSMNEAIKTLSSQGWQVSSKVPQSLTKISLHRPKFPIVRVTLNPIQGHFPDHHGKLTIIDRIPEPILNSITGTMVITAELGHESVIGQYINFYMEHNRVGYARLGNDVIIITPKNNFSNEIFPNLQSSQLLAVCFKREISKSMKQLQEFLENNSSSLVFK